MFRKLIKQTAVAVGEYTVDVRYYRTITMSGVPRYSAEVVFQPTDHMILDADSMNGLETRLTSLMYASVYSRTLVGRAA